MQFTLTVKGIIIQNKCLFESVSMSTKITITDKLNIAFSPDFLQVTNESDNHNVPPGSESHFKVTIVCEKFNDQSLIARHRMVNEVLTEELKNDIHALAIHTYNKQEWSEKQHSSPQSPPCLGGGK